MTSRRIGLLLSMLAAIVIALPAEAQVQVAPGHPRLYLRPGDEPALRSRAANPEIASFYRQLKDRMDAAAGAHANAEVAGFEIESLALLHVVEAPSMVYRDRFLSSWARVGYSGGVSHWDLPFQVMGHALALDWMWSDLTTNQRSQLGAALIAMTDELFAYAPHDTGPPPGSPNQMSVYSNQLYFHLGALAFSGIVLAGEGIDDAKASFYLAEADHLIRDHMIPATNQQAGGDTEMRLTAGFAGNGGWGEDLGHVQMTHPMFGRMLEAWRTGTGQDYFAQANGLATIAKYFTYLRRPGGGFTPKGYATYPGGIADKHIGTLGCLTSARYGDRFGRHLKEVTASGTTYGFHQSGAVLWCDTSLPPLDLDSLPGTVHFQGQGEVVVRSGFGASDTWMYLRSGPIYNGHQHDDQGHFLLEAYGGELFVENAGDNLDATIHHNTLRIGGDQIPYGHNQVQYARPFAGTPQERGRVTAVVDASSHTYVATDFGTAYPDSVVAPPKQGKVTREFVAIFPDILIVRDRVQGNGTIEFQLHAWPGTATIDTAARTATIAHGSGRGWVKTILPADATWSVIPHGDTERLVVTDPRSETTRELLHLFYLSPAAKPFLPTDLATIDEADAEGVRLTDRAGDVWEIRFEPEGPGLIGVARDSGGSGRTRRNR